MRPQEHNAPDGAAVPAAVEPPSRGQELRKTWSDARVAVLTNTLLWGARTIGAIGPVRRSLFAHFDRRIRGSRERALAAGDGPAAMVQHGQDMALAILHTMERAVEQQLVGAATLRGTLNIIARTIVYPQSENAAQAAFVAGHQCLPPALLALSPGKACNLRCAGCYADSGPSREKLDWDTLNRIVWDAQRLWGVRFFVVTGGEPLAYSDRGKGILDMAQEHHDRFFLMYTNGTLIDDRTAERLAALGNLTPAISVEGMRSRTDARRGAGVFDRVVAAMGRLRRAHVPFGLSLTATRENAEEILANELLDYFFGELGAMYAWLFHYMPIGRAHTLGLMPTPRQRLALMERMWQVVGQRHYFVADFWNSGILSDGCVAAGKQGGYLHIDWNGAISPCVFVPYSPVNIHDIYAQGKDLNDVWAEPFFAGIREWQRQYNPGLGAPGPHPNGNLFRPCPIRDHHAEFLKLLALHEPDPTDDNARAALLDPAYHEGLEQFDRELASLSDPLWESRYQVDPADHTGHNAG